MGRKISIGIGFISLFVCGFIREYTFESINKRLGVLSGMPGNYELGSFLSGFNSFEYTHLYYTKFLLILAFALLFMGISMLLVRLIFHEAIYMRYTAFFFAGIFSLSFSLFVAGYLLGNMQKGYSLARFFIEFIESPLATFFIIPALYLLHKSKADNHSNEQLRE